VKLYISEEGDKEMDQLNNLTSWKRVKLKKRQE